MTRAEVLLAHARAKGWRVATAESCTGGLVAAAITEVPRSSDIFDRGVVTYSNAAKADLLGVRADTLAAHGAVSEAVAAEMAAGLLARSQADVAVSVTGIAGPGGSEFKPEGRVCFGLAVRGGVVRTGTVEFGARGRSAVRAASVDHALDLLLSVIPVTGPARG
jgi:nicotinamide-nucleotide amidase